MNLIDSNLTIFDVIGGERWCESALHHVFGPNLNLQSLSFVSFDLVSLNHWAWSPSSKQHKISSSVYAYLNHGVPQVDPWHGWRVIWKLYLAPRTKHFIWTLLHGRLSTSNFLSYLHLGPDIPCRLCGLSSETIDHLFCYCPKAKQVWAYLSLKLNTFIHFPLGFGSGLWVTEGGFSTHIISVISATAWMIWKSRCDVIFRNTHFNVPTVVCRAIAHVQEFTVCRESLFGQMLILNNIPKSDNFILFTYSCVQQASEVCSTGFFITNTNYVVKLAGCFSFPVSESSLENLSATTAALQSALDHGFYIKHIFVQTPSIASSIFTPEPVITWRFRSQLEDIRFLLNVHDSPRFHCIPRLWMSPAVHLASLGLNFSTLNLFLFGRDLPRWLMKAFTEDGFLF
ncbi:uncharacterized protein LOC120255096 [Dioscorea cayenensis subsp. rotundata]|uniref:Uncharacterized protein LOC120255096 n=1 Tax=Dioscorea cayennensis subsp. rotundata TaxID=55577 RepID=A0AB40AV91_DIOCR|nr:uncharacterized protein LOC120255096 [Dioscorea cayenensis subsp. rotundata]